MERNGDHRELTFEGVPLRPARCPGVPPATAPLPWPLVFAHRLASLLFFLRVTTTILVSTFLRTELNDPTRGHTSS